MAATVDMLANKFLENFEGISLSESESEDYDYDNIADEEIPSIAEIAKIEALAKIAKIAKKGKEGGENEIEKNHFVVSPERDNCGEFIQIHRSDDHVIIHTNMDNVRVEFRQI